MQFSWWVLLGDASYCRSAQSEIGFHKTPTPRDITNVTIFPIYKTAPFNVGAAGEGSICSSVLALNIEGCVFPPK